MSPALLAYSIAFILIPLASVALYWLRNGGEPYEGFALLKGYLLIGLAPMLALNRIDLMPALCTVLTVLALTIIGTFIALWIEPDFYVALSIFGATSGVVVLDTREYGSDLSLLQVYYVTSPMLAISIAYYFVCASTASRRAQRLRCWLLTALSIVGMLLAGTRNNMLVSGLLPVALFVLCSRHRTIGTFLGIFALAAAAILYANELAAFLDPTEFSNRIKLALLRDYARAFENPTDLLLGQGLGAYHYWEAKSESYYISELTYLELIRNFGVFGAAAMITLLCIPIWLSFKSHRRLREKAIATGYLFYLLMCIRTRTCSPRWESHCCPSFWRTSTFSVPCRPYPDPQFTNDSIQHLPPGSQRLALRPRMRQEHPRSDTPAFRVERPGQSEHGRYSRLAAERRGSTR